MKTRNTILRNVVVALAVLLAAGAAQGQTVMCGSSPCVSGDTSATGILDLSVGGTLYDVTFVFTDAEEVYGPPPGVYDFTTEAAAKEAVDAVNVALNSVPTILRVIEISAYRIGFAFVEFLMQPNVEVLDGFYREEETAWLLFPGGSATGVYTDETVYADFEEAGGTPAPTIDFTADPATIELGGTSTLSWLVTDADSCTGSLGSGGWPGAKDPVSGSEDVSPTATSTYRLTCDGSGGQSESELMVTVPDPDIDVPTMSAYMLAGLALLLMALGGAVIRWRAQYRAS
jgi:hypothetical protein